MVRGGFIGESYVEKNLLMNRKQRLGMNFSTISLQYWLEQLWRLTILLSSRDLIRADWETQHGDEVSLRNGLNGPRPPRQNSRNFCSTGWRNDDQWATEWHLGRDQR